MIDHFIEWFRDLPPGLATFIIATLPIGELRASIPIAILEYDMHPAWSFILSIVGNMVPVFIGLAALNLLVGWLRKKVKLFDRFFTWLFSWTQRRHQKKFKRWGDLALIVLVAIPLPMTGAYTGAMASYVFGVPPKRAIPLIFIGVLIAGIIVTAATMGVFSFI
ncbi:small multi-drug export protein [Patescibacteria group bacterium]|nr:small multi-drug export protein [Patescibacteria group bacterium]